MELKTIHINKITEGYHPRKDLSGQEELEGSIEKNGSVDPISVRKDAENYVVIDGLRRLRAVKEGGLPEIDCIIEEVDEKTAAHLSYTKNSEDLRRNLNPIEVAYHIKSMRDRFGYSVRDLVDLGYAKDDQTIYNKLNLLQLPGEMQEKIADKSISPTIGYKLGAIKDRDLQSRVFHKIMGGQERTVKKSEKIIKDLINSVNREKNKPEQEIKIPEGDIPGVFLHSSENMSEFEDGSVPLIITSPNYWVGLEYEERVTFKEHINDLEKCVTEWGRKICPGGCLCINFGDIHNFGSRNGTEPEIKLVGHIYQELLEPQKIRLRDIKIWEKGMTFANNRQVSFNEDTKHTLYRSLNNFEYIYIFKKDGEREVPYDLALRSEILEEEWRQWVPGTWKINPVARQKDHPAQFPEEIPRRLIKMFSYEGELVIDPALGSGTTIKVARELCRIGYGYERDLRYKPVIMKKLGVKEEDLRESGKAEGVRKEKIDIEGFGDHFEQRITEIVAGEGKTAEDIRSITVPYKPKFSKEDIVIDWASDPDDSDPSGSPTIPVLHADDYEEAKHYPLLVLPERKRDTASFLNTVICGDCFKKCMEVETETIDLVITSPPYADTKNYGTAVKVYHPDEYVAWILPLFKEIHRILKPTGSFILNINDRIVKKQRHPFVHELIARAIRETDLKLYDVYYWVKRTALPTGNQKRLNNITEYLVHFCKDEHLVKMNMDAVREPYDTNTVKRCEYPVKGFDRKVDQSGKPVEGPRKKIQLNENGKVPSNVFYFPTAAAVRGTNHPASFHRDLPTWFIRALTDEGDTVLDPFAGVGTSCVAAKRLQRRYIGIELSPFYHEIAVQNLQESKPKKAAEGNSKVNNYNYEVDTRYPVLVLPEKKPDLAPYVNTVIQGDCLKKLKPIPDNSVDLLATDPPYGINFMGEDWDKEIPSVDTWKEILRVLKPGALAFVMSSVRQDVLSRMIVSLEEAGFKTDFSPLYWTYASGFPKAYNVAKGIEGKVQPGTAKGGECKDLTGINTKEAKAFVGSYAGFQPKPAVEAIIVAMKPMDKKTYGEQALENGKGITWLDDCRIPFKESKDKEEYIFNMNGNQRTAKTEGEKLGLYDGGWKVNKAQKDIPQGRFPANLLVSDSVLDDGKEHRGASLSVQGLEIKSGVTKMIDSGKFNCVYGDTGGYSRFFSLDAWAEKNLPFLIVPKASKKEKDAGLDGLKASTVNDGRKKSIDNPSQRGTTPRKNGHMTVKPIKLMSYLITMGSRKGDVVLDPFTGSGSTCVAAKKLNRNFIGVELDKDYHAIAQKRVEYEEPIALKEAA